MADDGCTAVVGVFDPVDRHPSFDDARVGAGTAGGEEFPHPLVVVLPRLEPAGLRWRGPCPFADHVVPNGYGCPPGRWLPWCSDPWKHRMTERIIWALLRYRLVSNGEKIRRTIRQRVATARPRLAAPLKRGWRSAVTGALPGIDILSLEISIRTGIRSRMGCRWTAMQCSVVRRPATGTDSTIRYTRNGRLHGVYSVPATVIRT